MVVAEKCIRANGVLYAHDRRIGRSPPTAAAAVRCPVDELIIIVIHYTIHGRHPIPRINRIATTALL